MTVPPAYGSENVIKVARLVRPSNWQMRHGDITYIPTMGNEPNWFHRWMQRLAFGFRWERRT